MRVLTSVSLSLLLAGAASAQNVTFLTDLAQELSNLGLTSLVAAVTSINSSSAGQNLLAQLGNSTQTVFAPNNQGFSGIHPNISSSPDLLANVLSYHVLPGSFDVTQTFPNTTVGRTLLSHNSSLVFLEGDRNQVLAWATENGTIRILNQNTEVSVVNTTTFQNLTIHVVDAVIDVPGEFTAALDANNLTAFRAALTTANFLDTLNTVHGVTIFAPTDAAFAAVQQNLTAAGSNASVLDTILRNHVINGSSVYSGNLEGGGSTSATSSAGETFSSTFNASGAFVTSGNVTAKIVTPDIVLWNGVLHVVDHVFLNEDSDPGAASSAASSASSAATASTTQTGPIGFTPSPTSTSASGSSSSSGGSRSGSSSAADRAVEFPLRNIGFAGLVGALGVIAGGLLAL